MLSKENPLLKQQINLLNELNQLHQKTDSIQKEEISICKDKIEKDSKTISKLKKTQTGIIIGSSIGGLLLFIIGLIL